MLAVPLMAAFKIIAGHYWRTRVLGESWQEVSEAQITEHPTGETLISRIRRGDGAGGESESDGRPPPPSDGVPPADPH